MNRSLAFWSTNLGFLVVSHWSHLICSLSNDFGHSWYDSGVNLYWNFGCCSVDQMLSMWKNWQKHWIFKPYECIIVAYFLCFYGIALELKFQSAGTLSELKMCWWCKFWQFPWSICMWWTCRIWNFWATIARFEIFCVQKMAHDDALGWWCDRCMTLRMQTKRRSLKLTWRKRSRSCSAIGIR